MSKALSIELIKKYIYTSVSYIVTVADLNSIH